MPKNDVSDPITSSEVTFAQLLLSGSMNDREAAEAAGLNPTTAAYTKAKPRVRAYMESHRAAVHERVIEQEAAGLRSLNLCRDQILVRLWQLANLSAEQTRGSIAGQIKAMTMIIAIEGLVPDRPNQRADSSAQRHNVDQISTPELSASEWGRRPQEDLTRSTGSHSDVGAETQGQSAAGPVSLQPEETEALGDHNHRDVHPEPVANTVREASPASDGHRAPEGFLGPPLAGAMKRFGRSH